MENVGLLWSIAVALWSVNCCGGLAIQYSTSPCGDWIPYLHETCFKFVDRAGAQNKENAEAICAEFAQELHQDDVPKLITIKTKEKQEMVQTYLFGKQTTFDNVWLGLDMNSEGEFRWNDGTKLLYLNWAKQNMSSPDRRCVQMESGEGVFGAGKWSTVHCLKKNAIICERAQPWSTTTLQNTLISLMLEVEKNQKASDEKVRVVTQELNKVKQDSEKIINALKQESNSRLVLATNEINALKQNPVPVGFLYTQLPGRQPPTVLWPQVNWKDVTAEYAGLFFRVEGGSAAPFGQVQGDNTRRLLQVSASFVDGPDHPFIPEDGSWSTFRWTGGDNGRAVSTRYRLTTGEIRPRNQAVKIWQRV